VELARANAELSRVQAKLQARLLALTREDVAQCEAAARARKGTGKLHAAGAPLAQRMYKLRYISPGSVVYQLGLSDSPGPEAFGREPRLDLGVVAGKSPGSGGGELRPFMPDGIEDVVSFPALNSLLARGTPEGLEAFGQFLTLIDKKPQQVLISAVTHGGLPGNVPLPDPAIQEGKPKDGAWVLPLPAAEKEFRFTGPVTDAMRVLTFNLQAATCEAKTTRQGVASAVRLSLIPRINGDRTITLYVSLTRRRSEAEKEMTTTSVVNVRDGEPLAITFTRDGESSTLILTTSIVKEGEGE
jgi:hypothetical protein